MLPCHHIRFVAFVLVVSLAGITHQSSLAADATPDPVAIDGRWGIVPGSVAADPDSCDFEAMTCKISEDEFLDFEFFLTNTNPLIPLCLFIDPRTLPPGASFPAESGMSKVRTEFQWTPHECQAGEYEVHIHASFLCFDFFFGGIFVLTITVNDAVPCEVIGACCKPDGDCQDLTEEECTACDGGFDPNRLCKVIAGPLICPLELGACCKGDGTCVDDETEESCDLFQLGEFLGVGTSCPSISIDGVCNGACSTSGFTCVDGVTKNACEAQTPHNGHFRGAGTTCKKTPPGSGACCFPDGGCFHLPHERDCKNRLGKFQGAGTECAHLGGDVVCPVTGGSCCPGPMPQFTGCQTAEPLRCGLLGGTVVAPGACPAPTKCPPAKGACCIFDDLTAGGGLICVDGRTLNDCLAIGEAYLGDGSKCGDDDNDGVDNCCDQCPNTPPGEPVVPCQIIIITDNFSGCSCTQRREICDDGNVCTRDVCAPNDPMVDKSGCLHRPDPACCDTDADCDDNDACTLDVCVSRTCTNSAFTCENDGINCTIDRCHRVLGCNYPDHTRCDDRNRCTVDACVPGQGCTNVQKMCNDGFTCTHDRCNHLSGDCQFNPDDVLCYDNDPCTTDTCDPENPNRDGDGCVFTPRQVSGPLECGDGDVNGDGVTDLNDLQGQTDCLNQSGPFATVENECPPADFDGDSDVDLEDWQFAMNDPFRCDPQNCEAGLGGKCVTTCQVDEICDPQDGVATGQTGGDCKRPCTSEIDCFSVGKCEACTDGFCKTRCDPMMCERACDGAGNCPSRCEENETCVDGDCKRNCFDDRDCRQDLCESCQDGMCVDACPEGQRCIPVTPFGPGFCLAVMDCATSADCPSCHLCVRDFRGAPSGCLPCEVLGNDCRDGKCRRKCDETSDCLNCERCEDGVCVNDCPDGKTCDSDDEMCQDECTSDADCGQCETCNFDAFTNESYCRDCTDDNIYCVRCDDDGACVRKCNIANCETCVPVIAGGPCRSYCDPETQMCDGAGNCVPR